MIEQIVILDFGSQYTQVIARRIRECNVYSHHPALTTPRRTKIAATEAQRADLCPAGRPACTPKAPLPDKGIFKLGVPMLGICYGLQLLAQYLGGKVGTGQKREYGKGTLSVMDRSLRSCSPTCRAACRSGIRTATSSPDCPRASSPWRRPRQFAITPPSSIGAKRFFGLQFHPEVVHTPRGREIITNFVHRVCGCGKDWTMRNYVEQAVEEIRAQVGDGTRHSRPERRRGFQRGGGADSQGHRRSTHLHFRQQRRASRGREAGRGAGSIRPHFKMKLQYEDASKLFLRRLKGVTEPERKRKIIGRTFIEVFQAATRNGRARRSFSRRARFTRTSSSRCPSAAIPPRSSRAITTSAACPRR